MNFTQKTMEDRTYLIYKVGPEEKVDELAYKMISGNQIDGVFKMNREDNDGVESFYINITSKITLRTLVDKPIGRELFLSVLESIVKSAYEADEYMLDSKYFLYDFDHIYVDLSARKAILIYLPIIREEEEINVKSFLKNMLFDVCYNLTEDCNYVARLINTVNSKSNVTFKLLLEVIDDIRKQGTEHKQVVQNTSNHYTENKNSTTNAEPARNTEPEYKPNPVVPPVNTPAIEPLPKTDAKGSKGGLFGKFFGNNKEGEAKGDSVAVPGAKSNPMAVPGTKGGSAAVPGVKPGSAAVPGVKPSSVAVPGAKNGPVAVPNVASNPVAVPGVKPNANVASDYSKPENNISSAQTNGNCNQLDGSSGHSGTIIIGGSAEDGRTITLPNSYDGTDGNRVAQITRVKTNEVIAINRPVFKIGREQDVTDYCIRDNSAIGRLHAQIENQDGQYYLRDMNSLNHSYIGNDPAPIQANQLYQLRSGLHFMLADEEFVFNFK